MLQALRAEIIVKPIYEEKRGTIIIPESVRQFKLYHGSIVGEVISLGPASKFKGEVKPGDKIYWQRHEGRKVFENRQLYFTIRERWILGKMLDNETNL